MFAELLARARADAAALRPTTPPPTTPDVGYRSLIVPLTCPNCGGGWDITARSARRTSTASIVATCTTCAAEIVVQISVSATGPRKRTSRPHTHTVPAAPATHNTGAPLAGLVTDLVTATWGPNRTEKS